MIKPWKILSSEYVVEDKWLTLRKDKCETSSGNIIEPFWVQECEDWVHVTAFNDKDEVLLIRQYRHSAECIHWEIPAGVIDKGENPAESIRRELLEETGCKVRELIELPAVHPNPNRYNNKAYGFLALGAEIVAEQSLDPSEDIEFAFFPLEKAIEFIDTGQFTSAIQIQGFYSALLKAGKMQLKI